MSLLPFIQRKFQEQKTIYWFNLDRITSLLIILNISLFFLTELVTKFGYYYTIYSLVLLGIVELFLIVPLGLLDRFWFYCLCLILELIAIFFLL